MSLNEDLEADKEELRRVIEKINMKTGVGYKVVTSDEYDKLKQSSPKPRFSFGNYSRSDSPSSYVESPKLPVFSGSDDVPKAEVNFEVWNMEVKCLQNADVPDHILSHSIRKSLRGTARSMLVPLGESASVQEILDKLEGCYGNVSTAEDLMQQFYGDCQKEGESIVTYATRLENTLSKAVRTGHINAFAKDNMLRSKFWTGLRNTQLRQATRHKYDNIKDFQTLLVEIRQVKKEEQNLVRSNPKSKPVQQHQAAASASDKFSNDDIYKQLCQLKSQLDKLERKMSSQGSQAEKSPETQTYAQGHGDSYRGRGRGYGHFRRGYGGRGPRRQFRGRGGNQTYPKTPHSQESDNVRQQPKE